MTMPLNRKISQKIVSFSRHASRISGRFILPMYDKQKVGIHHVHNHTSRSHHRLVLLVGTSSTGAALTTMPSVSLIGGLLPAEDGKSGVLGSFLSYSLQAP